MKSAFYLFCYRHRYKLLVCGLLLIVALYFLYQLGIFPSDNPKDSKLEASFREHRQAFETLCAMALEDSGKVSYISLETLPDDDLDSRRRVRYKDLLNEIKLVEEIRIDDHERVMFEFRAGGLAAFGPTWYKGIAYFPGGVREKDATVVDNLDNIGDQPGVYASPLEENWYLTYLNFHDE
jgi:hypothetical protein